VDGVVYLRGITGIGGVALAGGFTTAYSLKLWLTIVDTYSGSTLLNWLVNEWKDEKTVYVGGYVNRDQTFDWDYSISQTSVQVQAYRTYQAIVKFTGWVYVAAVAGAYAQSDIDFETGNNQMKLKWLTYDAPSGGPGVGGGGGGCPYVSTWDGSKYVLDNNLLPASESQAGVDVTDYYLLQQMVAQREDGTYSLMLNEFENEHDFFDRVQLIVVDRPSNVNVAVSPYGEILTHASPSSPVSAIDNNNRNVKHLLNSIDENFYEGYNGSYITLNFGDLDVSQGAKLVIRSDLFLLKSPIHIQTMDSAGKWQTVATIHTRRYWSTDIVDMSKYLPNAEGNLKVRLQFTSNDKIDFIGLDTSPQATIQVHEGQLISAYHSTDDDVTAKLLDSDQTYTELVPWQEIRLAFTLPAQTMEARNYIIKIEGHYASA